MRKFFSGLVICLYIMAISSPILAQGNSAGWASWGYNLENTRSTPSLGPQTNNLAWQYQSGRCNRFTSPLIVSNDMGYITDDIGNLYAIDLGNPKSTKWVYRIEEKYYYSPPSPFLDGNSVYVNSGIKISAISTQSGLPQKTYEIGAHVLGFTLHNKRLYVVDDDSNLSAIETNTGRIKWKIKLMDNFIPCYPAIDKSRNVIYVAGESHLCAVDLTNGTSRCYFEFPDSDEDYPIAEKEQDPGYYHRSTSPAIAEDGTVYIGHSDKMLAINPEGTLKWTFLASAIYSSAAISGDTIYFGDMSGMFYALNRNDASVRWSYQTQAPILSSAVIDGDKTSYFKSGDANVYALSSKGLLKWVYGTNQPYEPFTEITLGQELYITVSNTILAFGKNLPEGINASYLFK